MGDDMPTRLARIDENLGNLADEFRRFAADHRDVHKRIDDKLDKHSDRITALWTIFGVGGLAFLIVRFL